MRLGSDSSCARVLHSSLDGGSPVATQPEAYRRHDEARSELRSTVAKGERVAIERENVSSRRDALDRRHRRCYLAAVGARVHEECAADRSRDALRVLQAGEPARDRRPREPAEPYGRARPHLAPALALSPGEVREASPELHHDPRNSPVRDEQIRAAAQERHAHGVSARGPQHRPQLGRCVGEDEQVGGTADAERGVAGERLVGPGPITEQGSESRHERFRDGHASGWGRSLRHATAPAARRRCGRCRRRRV